MAVALVGSVGVVSQGAVGAAVTPAWGTSETRTAGNLLICWVAGTGSATAPAIPSGWSQGIINTATSVSSSIFYKVAAGADAAPTIAAITSAVLSVQLAEFSGTSATPLDHFGGANGTTSPLNTSSSGADAVAGDLIVACDALLNSAARTNAAWAPTFNNATVVGNVNNAATSTVNHYGFSYGTTTTAVAAFHSLAFTTTQVTQAIIGHTTFKAGVTITGTGTGAITFAGSGTATLVALGVYPAGVLALNPNAYWRMDDATGTTMVDLSPNHRNGTYHGGFTLGATSLLTGDPDKAVAFDGSTGYGVGPADNSFLDVFTVETWIKLNNIGTSGVAQNIIDGGPQGPAMQVATDGRLLGNRSYYTAIVDSGTNLVTANVRHHCVWTKNGSATHLYLDGVDVTRILTPDTVNGMAYGCYVGCSYDGTNTGYFVNGVIDEVSYYNYALTATQVLSNYNNGSGVVTVNGTGTGAITFAGSGMATIGAPFVTSVTGGTTRRDFDGRVGMEILIGANPVVVTALGRWMLSGNALTHVIHLIDATNNTVDLRTATVNTANGTPNTFLYGTISSVTLSAGGTYYLVSEEVNNATVAGSDYWLDDNSTVATTTVATDVRSRFWSAGVWNSNLASACYVPVNFLYLVTVTGTGTGAIIFNGSGTATQTVTSTGTGAIVFAGSGTATVTTVGTGTGAIVFAGSGTGKVQSNGTGTGAIVFGGSGVGTVTVTGTGTGAIVFNGTGTAAVTDVGAFVGAATAGLTVAASVRQLAAVTLAGGASLTVPSLVTELAAVSMAATAGMTVTTSVTEVASVSLSGTAGLVVAAKVTELASVSLSASGGLLIVSGGGGVVIASVALSGSSSLTVATTLVTEVAAVALTGSTSLTVVGLRTQFATVNLLGATSLTVAAQATHFASVAHAATAGLVIVQQGLVSGTALLSAVASLTMTPQVLIRGQITLTASTALAAQGLLTSIGQVGMASTAGLVFSGQVREIASVAMASVGLLSATGQIGAINVVVAQVAMVSRTSMVVLATVPAQIRTLAEQIAAVIGQDPLLLGAKGYVDNVSTSRLTDVVAPMDDVSSSRLTGERT